MTEERNLKRFWQDESGVLLAEALIMLPLLIWAFLALFVYWDLFRTINTSQKAAYSISDLMSRQAVVSPTFVDGMKNVLDFLTMGSAGTRMRITSIQYDQPNNRYLLLFSRSSSPTKMPAYTQASVQPLKTRVPNMSHLDSVIIVETEVDYIPGFNTGVMNVGTGVSPQTFQQFIVTRPRFYRRICMTIPVCPPDP